MIAGPQVIRAWITCGKLVLAVGGRLIYLQRSVAASICMRADELRDDLRHDTGRRSFDLTHGIQWG